MGTETLNPLEIRQKLHLSQEKMSHLLHVSAKTLWRWENQNSSPHQEAKHHLAKLNKIAEIALKVYQPAGISEFLTTPLDALGQRTALEMISLGEYDRVIGILAADYEGLGY